MNPAKRNIYIIAAIAFILLILGIYFLFIFQKGSKETKNSETSGEVKELADIELTKRPFVTLTPTSNGAEIIISIENMSDFDRIEYELTYLADNPQVTGDKIQRGATGTDVNTKDQKYKKSILLGTASKGISSPDKGITDGKLTMHMFKGDTEYQSETDWNLFQVGARTAMLKDLAGNFQLEVGGFDKDYWVILADTIGLPPSPGFDPKLAGLPIYGTFSIAPAFIKGANLTVKASEAQNPQLYSYNHTDSKWQKLDAKYDSSLKTISAEVNSFATFVVVSSK